MATKRKTTSSKAKKLKKKLEKPVFDWKVYMLLGGILLLTAFAFSPSLKNTFTNWDDENYVLKNTLITELNGENLSRMFDPAHPVSSNYHPLTVLSFALNYSSAKLNPTPYIATNIALHLINVIFAFYFILLLTKRNLWVALIVALLFAIHPMHVESVTWISERKDVLYAAFFLGAMIAYLRYLTNGKKVFLVLTFVLFTLSLLSKSAAVILPPVLLLLDYFMGRKWERKLWLEKIPFFALSLLFGLIAINTQSETAISDLSRWGFGHRILFACYGLVMYGIKLIAPLHLSSFYPYPVAGQSLPIIFYLAPVLVAGIAMAIYRWAKDNKTVIFGCLFFLTNLVLVLQFLPVGEAIMADRYTYLAYLGLFFILAKGIDDAIRVKWKNVVTFRYAAFGCLLLVAAFFSTLTYQRTQVWKNSNTLWSDVLEKHPNVFFAHYNKGLYHVSNGDPRQAFKDFSAALEVNSEYARAYIGRGNIYYANQENEKALQDFNQAVKFAPDNSNAYTNRAAVFNRLGKYNKGLKDLKKAIALDPDNANAYMNQAVIYYARGNYEEAITAFDKYLAINPTFAQAYHNRGLAKRYLGQNKEALKDFNRAIQLEPDKASYYLSRSYTHSDLGHPQKAEQDALRAKQLGGG